MLVYKHCQGYRFPQPVFKTWTFVTGVHGARLRFVCFGDAGLFFDCYRVGASECGLGKVSEGGDPFMIIPYL